MALDNNVTRIKLKYDKGRYVYISRISKWFEAFFGLQQSARSNTSVSSIYLILQNSSQNSEPHKDINKKVVSSYLYEVPYTMAA